MTDSADLIDSDISGVVYCLCLSVNLQVYSISYCGFVKSAVVMGNYVVTESDQSMSAVIIPHTIDIKFRFSVVDSI